MGLRNKKMVARKLRSKHYSKIIEVRTPIRFYWTEQGFDGVEFGAINCPISQYQIKLLHEALDTIADLMGIDIADMQVNSETRTKHKTPLPDYLLRAFKEDKQT